MKFGIRKAISYTLIFILCVSSVVAIYDSSASASKTVASASQVSFEDVTGDVDLSSIAMQNLASSVIEETTTATKNYSQHTVIVTFDGNNLVDEAGEQNVSDYANSQAGKKKISAIKQKQDNFLHQLDKLGISYSLKNRYTAVSNAVAIEVNTAYVSQIKEIAGVKSVCLSETYMKPETVDMSSYATASSEDLDKALQEGLAVTNKTSVYKTGVYDSSSVEYKGAGSVVAILDTGLDYTHNAFIWDEEHESVYSLDEAVFDKSTISNALASGNLIAEEKSALNGVQISANDLYVSKKVPFAYDYADNDADVYPSYSNHGTHVAGIVAGYDPSGYTDKDGNAVDEPFVGVAPQAQLVICKVFTDDLDDSDVGGAETEDILAALEDCILLGVDVINMSLGTACGFTTTDDGDEEGEMLNEVYNSVLEAGISLVCAASNDYSAAYGGTFGTNLASNPDSGTVGSPSVFAAALSVASISGQNSPYMLANDEIAVYYEESSDQYNKYYDFAEDILAKYKSVNKLEEAVTKAEFTYVSIPGTGRSTDFSNSSVKNKVKGNIALVKRGGITFKEKVENAKTAGAIGIIVYNNVSGTVRMALGEVKDPIPSCCISMEVGEKLVEYASKNGKTGKIVVDLSQSAGPFMSEFSSWGVTPDLKLKPEVTAHGGEITSAVPGGYGEQSGTSMASPNMAGVVSIIRSYLKSKQSDLFNGNNELTQRVNQLVMSTATLVYDRDKLPYSPRKQGAGLGSLENAISTGAYLYTTDQSIDYRPKVNLGDDAKKVGVYNVTFRINNFSANSLEFEFNPIFMTERLASNNLAVAEQAYILDDITPTWTVKGAGATKNDNILTIAGGSDAEITVTFTLSDAEKEYIDDSFRNGMYVEGFVNLVSNTDGQCDLNLPFLGFYGDWAKVPILDCTYEQDENGNYITDDDGNYIKHINDAYYIDEAKADSSIDDEDKPQASIWATQPYTKYYNDQFSMPMGSFAYLQDENADRVYTTMEHNSISCYDTYYGDDDENNYLTTYEFRGLYLGLMRGARKISYNLVDDATGEVLYENTAYRVNKAYSGGGSAVPGYLKFEINPLDYNMVSNGKYSMNFDFYCDYGDKDRTTPDDSYSFSFYCDYEAPSLREVRVRYQDYKENNKTKQRIYLDMDVYDNHYSQAALLCYFDGEELQQVTEYVVPFYNCVKNSTNTVSIEITDIYEQYGDKLYVQFDDYALNHAVYHIDLQSASGNATPDSFELAEGEDDIKLDIYQTHKISLVYDGSANISNFSWSSDNVKVANVKNGEIVGLSKGTATITVKAGNDKYKKIKVTVSDVEKKLSLPSISFGTLINYNDKLVAGDSISLYPDQDVTLTVNTDPWYYPQEKVKLRWESSRPSVVSVDQNGKLNLITKGTASIDAILLREDGSDSSFRATIRITVLDPFVVSGYSLTKYRGKDELVEIPDDEMIMYISEDAFENNSTMKELIIPKTVININEGAFRNCTALEAIYLVSKEATKIPDADLKLVYRSAFEGCTSLKLLDLTNVKVITVAVNAFKNCTSLSEIKNMKAIGSAYAGAFEGCTSLTSIDLTGMQVAGSGVFKNCTSINEVITGQFTDIGEYMFEGCKALKKITLNNSVVGANAFTGCSKLESVTINGVSGENFVIENQAFYNSGLKNITFGDDCNVLSIGDKAFAKTKLKSITLPNGLAQIGANIFFGTTTLESVTLPASFDYEQIVLASGLLSDFKLKLADESQYTIQDNDVLYNKDMSVLLTVLDTSIKSIDIPSSVKTIYSYAFANTQITDIVIPETIETIGAGAFKGSSLTSIEIKGNITQINDETFRDTDLVSITLPSSVTKVGSYAFAGSMLLSIDLSNVKSVGSYAFLDCIDLYAVTITETLDTVGDYVFANCQSLTSVTLPAVKNVGEGVFAKSGLVNVVFGDKATTIGEHTFAELNNLKKVVLGSGIQEIGEFSFAGCSALEEVVLGNVKSIGEYAFAGCSKLKTIDLSKVEEFEDGAFYNCNALGDIDLSSAVAIGDGAFMIAKGEGGVKSVKFVLAEEIGVMAFYGTRLACIELPESLTSLGYGAFAYTSSLENIVAKDSKVFFVNGGVLYQNLANGGYELILYPATKVMEDKVYTVLDNTLRIDAYAFAGIGKGKEAKDLGVTHVKMPYSLTNIGDSAFFESGITEYTFGSLDAPVLETVYKEEVEEIAGKYGNYMVEPAINSYYYSNFNTLFVYYTTLVADQTGEVSPNIMHRPDNGAGYENYVYSRYFGTVKLEDTVQDKTTTEFIEQMKAFEQYTDAVLKEWQDKANAGDIKEYKEDVKAFADIVQEARRLYGNIKDEAQLEFIDDKLVERLDSVEITMRAIKKAYGIEVKIKQYVAVDGSYKKDYIQGESFDPTGIVVNRIYSDGSTETVDSSKLELLTEGVLQSYMQTVRFKDTETNTEFIVRIYVSETSNGGESSTPGNNGNGSTGDEIGSDSNSSSTSGGMIAVYVVVPIVAVGIIAVVVFFVLKKLNKIGAKKEDKEAEKAQEDNSDADCE